MTNRCTSREGRTDCAQNGFLSCYFLQGRRGLLSGSGFRAAGVRAVAAGVAGTVSITSTSVTTQLKRSFAHRLQPADLRHVVSARMGVEELVHRGVRRIDLRREAV